MYVPANWWPMANSIVYRMVSKDHRVPVTDRRSGVAFDRNIFYSSVLHLVESLRCQHPLPLPAMFGTRAPLGPALGGRAQRLSPTGQACLKTYFSSLLNPTGLSHFLTDIQVCIFRLCFLQTQYAPK